MRVVIFTHSLVSDWNHGNAHFLRGIASEFIARGHDVAVYEPSNSWSRLNLIGEHGQSAIESFQQAFPLLQSHLYDEHQFDPNVLLEHADLVLVHEWNSQEVVSQIGAHRSRHGYQLFFHDTHHRSLTDASSMASYDLQHYDGVLAYGNVIRDAYLKRGWARAAFTWHEAADTRTFLPIAGTVKHGDLVWIGNWGDGERAESLREFLIEPVRSLGLKAKVYGVRYPLEALQELAEAEIEYGGWLPNYKVPEIFASYRITVHVPRGPYVKALPGIPTIRPFEALACGIPMISAPWNDIERLFQPGCDFLFANNGAQMTSALEHLLGDENRSADLARHGLETIQKRHTCTHRVDELLEISERGAT